MRSVTVKTHLDSGRVYAPGKKIYVPAAAFSHPGVKLRTDQNRRVSEAGVVVNVAYPGRYLSESSSKAAKTRTFGASTRTKSDPVKNAEIYGQRPRTGENWCFDRLS